MWLLIFSVLNGVALSPSFRYSALEMPGATKICRPGVELNSILD